MCRLRPVMRDLDGAGEVVGRQLEVAGEQVAGAAGEQAHRHPGADHLLGHGPHGAVATEGAHDVDLLGEGLAGLAEADVVLRGLDEERLVPPLLRADPGDDLVHVVVGAVELGRVEHDREPLARGWRGVVARRGSCRGPGGSWRACPSLREDTRSQTPASTRTTATATPTQVHHPSDTVWKVQHPSGRTTGAGGRPA